MRIKGYNLFKIFDMMSDTEQYLMFYVWYVCVCLYLHMCTHTMACLVVREQRWHWP